MSRRYPIVATIALLGGLAGCATCSSHREAPVTKDPPAMVEGQEATAVSTNSTQIEISASTQIHSLGGPLVLTIRHINRGATSVAFRDPAKTWEVQLRIRRPSEGEAIQVPFGQIFQTEYGGVRRQVVEEAETITLAPGEEFIFDSDIGSRWPELFRPGDTLLQVMDLSDDHEQVSNEIRVTMSYDDATFSRLVALGADGGAPLSSRRFAHDWIHRVHPLFERPPERDEGEPPLTSQAAAATLAWWQEHRNDPEIIARIDRLNH